MWNFSFPQFSDSPLQFQRNDKFLFHNPFLEGSGRGKGDVYNLFFQEEKSIVIFMLFSHREKKKHKTTGTPFPPKISH